MLHLRPSAVDDALLERVVSVLEKTQQAIPRWSSSTPIIADDKGQVLYPTSVEIARSLLASISLFERYNSRTQLRETITSQVVSLVKRYWTWLKRRRTTIVIQNDQQVAGWHSEHLMDPALIHTWETSQILEFCVAFRDQMRRHISAILLTASRLKVEIPKTQPSKWKALVDIYEPVVSLGTENKVYENIGERFIAHISATMKSHFGRC